MPILISNYYSNFAVGEQLRIDSANEIVLAKPHLHIGVSNLRVEKQGEIQSSMSFLVKDSTGMAFVVADVDFAEAVVDVEVITVGLDDLL